MNKAATDICTEVLFLQDIKYLISLGVGISVLHGTYLLSFCKYFPMWLYHYMSYKQCMAILFTTLPGQYCQHIDIILISISLMTNVVSFHVNIFHLFLI